MHNADWGLNKRQQEDRTAGKRRGQAPGAVISVQVTAKSSGLACKCTWSPLTLAMRLGSRKKSGKGGFGKLLKLGAQVEEMEVPQGW